MVHAVRFVHVNGAGLLLLLKRATVASMTMDTENFGHPMSTPFPQPRVRAMPRIHIENLDMI